MTRRATSASVPSLPPKLRVADAGDRTTLCDAYRRVRAASLGICAPLQTEDYVVQTMADVSPPKWPLAHTTWFFETFILATHFPRYREYHPQYCYLFNSKNHVVCARC